MNIVVLLILLVLFFGAFPMHGYSAGWGYYPSGGIGLLILILIVLFFMGRL